MTLAAIGFANAADLPMPAPAYKGTTSATAGSTTGPAATSPAAVAMRGGPRIARSSRPQAALPFSPRSPTAARLVRPGPRRLRLSIQYATCQRWSVPIVWAGVFGDWEGGSIRSQNSNPLAVGTENRSSTWAVGGRAGYLVTPRFLTLFDGGFTQARFDQINYNFSIAGGGGPTG